MKKEVTVTLKFEIEVNDIFDSYVKAKVDNQPEHVKEITEHAEMQRRLLQAFISNKTAMNLRCKQFILEDLNITDESFWDAQNANASEDELILTEVLPTLSKSDEKYFRKVIEEEMFSENAPIIYDSFDYKMTSIEIEGLE